MSAYKVFIMFDFNQKESGVRFLVSGSKYQISYRSFQHCSD